jgi:hypothetical protein
MANDALIDFLGDGASSDTLLSYPHIQTVGYSGPYADYAVPGSANYPPAGKDSSGNAVNPSRYIIRLNFTPFVNGNLPMQVKSGGTTFSLVSGVPAVNQYRWWYNTNNSTVSPDVLEFNSANAGNTISIDCYAKQSILHAGQMNAPLISGNLSIGGNAAITGTTAITGNTTITGNLDVTGTTRFTGNSLNTYSYVGHRLANAIYDKTFTIAVTGNYCIESMLNINIGGPNTPGSDYYVGLNIDFIKNGITSHDEKSWDIYRTTFVQEDTPTSLRCGVQSFSAGDTFRVLTSINMSKSYLSTSDFYINIYPVDTNHTGSGY